MDDQSEVKKTAPISDTDIDVDLNSETISQRDTAVLHAHSHLKRLINPKPITGPLNKQGLPNEIVLLIRGMAERIPFQENLVAVIGRADLRIGLIPDFDLTRYGAEERGVSREHARLEVKNGRLFITDLNSTNGTFIGGVRIQPHEIQEIRPGDEFLVGRLAIRVLVE
jgi:pSer/pThr/pTyr-binding forkhead associated (FHA) protein